jgi:hypothetical protein
MKGIADRDEILHNLSGATNAKATLIETEQSRQSASYGTLTTPDKVEGIVLPTKGLIVVSFDARWKSSSAAAGRAAIFLTKEGGSANQYKAKVDRASTGAVTMAACTGATAAIFEQLFSAGSVGLAGITGWTGAAEGSLEADVTTGQGLFGVRKGEKETPKIEVGGTAVSAIPYSVTGGPTYVLAEAGTYTVDIRFKATSGSVTAINRRLYVWTREFV